jgi:hypothetical protein
LTAIPSSPTSTSAAPRSSSLSIDASPLPIDAEIYKWRHLIENFFCKLKEFKRIAMRADKTDQSFAALRLLRVFSDWLAAILLANQAGNAGYPLTTSEVRSILRRAGHSSLSSFAHRLAMEMESANSQQKQRVWNEIAGPVFQGSWPLDVELQTPRATFKLVQILLATDSAFSAAATAIIPFIRSEGPRDHTSIHSISHASEDLYKRAPQEMLDLLSAIAGDAPDRSLYGLSTALHRLQEVAPQLAQTKQFQRLATQATPY